MPSSEAADPVDGANLNGREGTKACTSFTSQNLLWLQEALHRLNVSGKASLPALAARSPTDGCSPALKQKGMKDDAAELPIQVTTRGSTHTLFFSTPHLHESRKLNTDTT